MREMGEHASEVVPGLWVSGMPAPDWPLLDWGVTLLVSLSDHLPPQAARRFEWGTRGEAAGAGRIVFLHWPIEDGALPDLDAAHLVAHSVARAVRSGRTVLLHCQEGRNRSGLIAALAVRELAGASGAEAVSRVRAARPGMLANRTFAEHLTSLPAPLMLRPRPR